MKIAVRCSQRLAPCVLASALALCLPGTAAAGNLDNGASHTVVAGDPKEDWTVQRGSTLTLAAGASAGLVYISGQSSLIATDAEL